MVQEMHVGCGSLGLRCTPRMCLAAGEGTRACRRVFITFVETQKRERDEKLSAVGQECDIRRVDRSDRCTVHRHVDRESDLQSTHGQDTHMNRIHTWIQMSVLLAPQRSMSTLVH